MDIDKRLEIKFEENELIFIQNCIVYFLCCHVGDVQNAKITYEGAREVAMSFTGDVINDIQKRIATTLGIKEEVQILNKEPEQRIILYEKINDNKTSKLIM